LTLPDPDPVAGSIPYVIWTEYRPFCGAWIQVIVAPAVGAETIPADPIESATNCAT
jgi:hypothetical protein